MATDNGKAPLPQTGFKPNGGASNPSAGGNLIKVEPPRREDLQPAYAQTLQGDTDEAAHGWYGSMSKFPYLRLVILALTSIQSTALVL